MRYKQYVEWQIRLLEDIFTTIWSRRFHSAFLSIYLAVCFLSFSATVDQGCQYIKATSLWN